jgi:hypothetical protein
VTRLPVIPPRRKKSAPGDAATAVKYGERVASIAVKL